MLNSKQLGSFIKNCFMLNIVLDLMEMSVFAVLKFEKLLIVFVAKLHIICSP